MSDRQRWYERFWIHHPMVQNPVGPIRWLAYKTGEWMEHRCRRMQWWALDPEDDIPF